MTISRTTQNQLEKGDFDTIESEWLARAESSPTDLEYFVGVARALVGSGQEARARALLEILDEGLRGAGHWAARLQLLKRAGTILLPTDRLYPAISSTLGKLHGDKSTFKALAEAVGLQRATHDLAKIWEKVDRLESLLAFDVGTVVTMEGKGVGQIVEANLGLESFKVDFERVRGLTVGFKAAPKLLQPLSTAHVLRIKLEKPATLKSMLPPDLLRLTLESYGRPLTAGEVREILAGVVTESGWTSWWSAARKHQQVVASGTGARQTYSWATSSGHALDSVWKAFAKADPRKKIERLKREGARDIDLRDKMAQDLIAVAEAAQRRDPGLAFEIWFAVERSGAKLPDDLTWTPDDLLEGNPQVLFGGIQDRLLRERAYTMLREREEQWTHIYREALLREQDPRALDLLADGLTSTAPREARPSARYPLRPAPPLPRRLHLDRRTGRDRRDAARPQPPPPAAADPRVAVARRVRPLPHPALALAESGGTVPRLLNHLSEDQAPQAEDAVQRCPSLERYHREQLINAIQLRFQGLRKDTGPAPLYATPAAAEAKRIELQQILAFDIPANRKAIEEARALGDLRENFEYKSARQRHEYLNSRAASLNAELNRVRIIDTAGTDLSEVRIGSRVRFERGGAIRTLTVLGPWESKPEEDIISYESELAVELLGKKVGETAEMAGESWTIAGIEPYT